MGIQLLHWSCTILLSLCPLLFNSAYPAMAALTALPGCRNMCGKISIPYPFGMKPGCYLEDSFKINCQNNTTPKILSGLEVLQISTEDGTIDVKSNIYSLCHTNSNSSEDQWRIMNLNSTPFSFSSTHNRLTAVGCNTLALLFQGDITEEDIDTNEDIEGGCMSICDKAFDQDKVDGACTGINCCQTTVPSSLQVTSIVISNLSGTGDRRGSRNSNCMYAFLANHSWFDSKVVSSGNLSEVAKFGYVPVVLNWEVDNHTYAPILNERSNELHDSSNIEWKAASCKFQDSSISNGSVVRCSCSKGAKGNPYVPNGCSDINECSLGQHSCLPQQKCINIEGGYNCWKTVLVKRKHAVIIGLFVGFGVLIAAIGTWTLSKLWRKQRIRKQREKFFRRNGGFLLQEQLQSGEVNVERVKMFNSQELDKATDHFNVNRMLGQGGQGTVYKGMLADGRIVAVKRSKVGSDEGNTRQFINEVFILSQINHRNVVKLLGCCLETEFPLLVYEFIPNGNLFELLHSGENDEEVLLTWDMRLKISVEVSGALAYLHSSTLVPIYHRDVKTTNILLDEKYRAKVADFGASKSVTIDQTHVTTRVQGTFGYLDPEYFRTSQFTEKSDVYSFGVVIVELLTGLKPISAAGEERVRSLVDRFLICMDEDRLFDVVDKRIEASERRKEIILVANLARRCLNWTGKERPSMKEVARVLEGIQKSRQGSDNDSPTHATQQQIMQDSHSVFEVTSYNAYSSLDSTEVESLVGHKVSSSFSIN